SSVIAQSISLWNGRAQWSNRLHDLLRRIGHRIAGNEREPALSQCLLAGLHIVTLETDDERQVEMCFLDRCDDASRDHVAIHDAAKNIHENTFDVRIAQNDFEGGGDLLFAGSAADIEQVCWLTAVV